ncbi:MAG: amidase family protein, partial [Nanoarchaeota archaeon]
CGSSGETSAFGACKNPAALELIPGGSSSGSAASVAAGFCDMALGSDTGGSIRNPASHCGVVGVKPTYGLVSRYGLIDLSMSLEQIGSFARNTEDALLLLNVIKGKDERDSTSYDSKEIKIEKTGTSKLRNFDSAQKFRISDKIKIGIPEIKIQDKRIVDLINNKVKEIAEKNKWEIVKIKLPHIDLAVQTYYPLCYVEFFSGTRRFDGRRYGKKIEEVCGEEVLRRILGGQEISRAEYKGRYYRKALQAKQVIKEEFEKAFEKVSCIIMPTVHKLPHKLGSKISVEEMYNYDALTIPANLAEIPGISVPAGKISGIPVGLQVMCKRFDESLMFSIAKEFE